MTAEFILLGVAVAAFAYLLIEYQQLRSTEDARDELIALAAEMMSDPAFPDVQKDAISDLLDEAMDSWFMVQMVLRLPRTFIRQVRHQTLVAEKFVFDRRFSRFLTLHQRCTTAANPLFGLIYRLEVAVMVLLLGGVIVAGAVVTSTATKVAKSLSQGERSWWAKRPAF